MKARVWIILVLLAGMMMAGADKPGSGEGKEAGDKEAKWVSLAPAKEGMGFWKALNFGGEGDTTWKGGTLAIAEGAEHGSTYLSKNDRLGKIKGFCNVLCLLRS